MLPLQQLLVSGSKDGSVLVVDALSGRVVSAMDKVSAGEMFRVASVAEESCIVPEGISGNPLCHAPSLVALPS